MVSSVFEVFIFLFKKLKEVSLRTNFSIRGASNIKSDPFETNLNSAKTFVLAGQMLAQIVNSREKCRLLSKKYLFRSCHFSYEFTIKYLFNKEINCVPMYDAPRSFEEETTIPNDSFRFFRSKHISKVSVHEDGRYRFSIRVTCPCMDAIPISWTAFWCELFS